MSRREQIGLGLAALLLAAAGIVAGTSQKNFTWTGVPMRVSYTFGFLALVCVVAGFGRRAWLHAAWAATLGRITPYLPRLSAPERRLRFRKRYDVEHARKLVAAGEMGGRMAQAWPGLEVGPAEITPTQVGYPIKSRRREQSTESEDAKQARLLREQGQSLYEELWVHADKAKDRAPYGALPEDYRGRAHDWYRRFKAFTDSHITPKDRYYGTERYPVWASMTAPFGSDNFIEGLDKMFSTNIAVLERLERRL